MAHQNVLLHHIQRLEVHILVHILYFIQSYFCSSTQDLWNGSHSAHFHLNVCRIYSSFASHLLNASKHSLAKASWLRWEACPMRFNNKYWRCYLYPDEISTCLKNNETNQWRCPDICLQVLGQQFKQFSEVCQASGREDRGKQLADDSQSLRKVQFRRASMLRIT